MYLKGHQVGTFWAYGPLTDMRQFCQTTLNFAKPLQKWVFSLCKCPRRLCNTIAYTFGPLRGQIGPNWAKKGPKMAQMSIYRAKSLKNWFLTLVKVLYGYVTPMHTRLVHFRAKLGPKSPKNGPNVNIYGQIT